jgi:hypothetical protein
MSTLSIASLALLAGSFASWVDWHNREVQATVLVIILATLALGAGRPRQAWLSALIVGGAIPCSYLLGPVMGFHPLEMPQPNIWGSFIAFIPAAGGAAVGAACRTIVHPDSH